MEALFSSLYRNLIVDKIDGKQVELLVIGGGITGCGIALDAASRGIDTLVLEMQDFAQGTSSRSTKLIHGGLRYLKQLEINVVAEVGKERAIVYENGPHVTTPEWMLLPIYKEGTFGKFSTSVGLKLYDFLAGVKKKERRQMLNREQTLAKAPLLKKDGLVGGGYYVEYRTDDARLTIEVVKKAVEQGACALNYSKVDGFIYDNGKAVGVHVTDQITGRTYKVYAKKIVNAAGPWVDSIRSLDNSRKGKFLQLTKGIHLVFDQKRFPLKQAVYFDTPDGRMIFAIPRDGKTYVGTTDTKYEGDPRQPLMTIEDRDYVIEAIRFMFPDLDISAEHIESSWVGLRPLIHQEGKKPSEISRKDEIWISDSKLITIAGGKLTGYRKMAEVVVDLVTSQFKEEGYKVYPACPTRTIPISGGDVGGADSFPAFIKEKTREGLSCGLTEAQAERLVRRYGSNVQRLYGLAGAFKDKGSAYGLPLDVVISLEYAIQEEMTVRAVDFFVRRTGALLFDRQWVEQYKLPVIRYMSERFGWTEETERLELKELNGQLEDAVRAV